MRGMERRQSSRQPVEIQTTLTVLGAADESEVELPARVEELSEQGARILVGQRLPTGACVKLVLEDCLYLGEVAYCRESAAGYQAGLILEHAIHSLSDLQWLMRSLLAESVTPRRDCESRPGWRSRVRR